MRRLLYIALFVVILIAGFSPVSGQTRFKVIGDIPHLPQIDPATIMTPEAGMLIFSIPDSKPMIYTGSAWETLCTDNIITITPQEFFVVKNGIPFLPAFSSAPALPLSSGTIYYSTVNKALMVYDGSSWIKMIDLLTGSIVVSSGFSAGVGVKTVKLPVLNSNPSPQGLVTGAFYINSVNKIIRYYNGSQWQDISCQAVVLTLPLTNMTGYTAMSGGEVITNGGSPITYIGICWGPTSDPDTLLTTKTKLASVGSGVGIFTSQLTDLVPKTTYHVRAYAVNSLGLVYGEDRSFITPIALPTIITLEASNIYSISTESGGDIIADGGAPVTARGIIWSPVSDPFDDPSHYVTNDGSGVGYFPSTMDGLLGNTPYYVRAYAVNAAGISYGNLVQFYTSAAVPPVLNLVVTVADINGESAVGTSFIMNNGGALVTERGICYSTDHINYTYVPSSTITPTDIGTFVTSFSGLLQGTTYYVKGYAKNIKGIGYTNETSLITTSLISIITIKPVAIETSKALSGGDVSNSGYATITDRGICWSTENNPTTNLTTKISEPLGSGDGTGAFTTTLTGLIPGVTYYVRSYAVNITGTAYGNQEIFAMPDLASVQTVAASSLHINTVTCGGNIINDGGSAVINRGVCWSTNANPTIYNSKTSNGDGTGLFTSVLTGLIPNANYHFRAYAENTIGVSYGDDLSFTIIPETPVIATLPVTNISSLSGTTGGNIQSDGGIAITSRGIMWSTQSDPLTDLLTMTMSVGSGAGNFTAKMDSLLGSTTYYIRAYAVNSSGTGSGDLRVFTTLPAILAEVLLPSFSMEGITNVAAVGVFRIKNNGGDPVTNRGIRYSTDRANYIYVPSGTLNISDIGVFVTNLTGLTPNTTYYVQAYAINAIGTALSNEASFKTTSLAALTTMVPDSVTQFSASSGGNVSSTGDDVITAKGVCWSTGMNPTSNLATKTSEPLAGTNIGVFVSSVTGLTPGMKYYVRAYAVTGFGVAYGNLDSLTTVANSLPLIKTTNPNTVTGFTAYSGGTITSIGEDVVSSRGICWSTGKNPTNDLDTKTLEPIGDGGVGSFSSYVSGLIPGTKYYIRAYAVNSFGVAYGNSDSLVTATTAFLTTTPASGITNTTALSGGDISDNGHQPVFSRGVCWSSHPNPTTADSYVSSGNGNGSFAIILNNLMGSTKYYIRAFAINSVGTSYGNPDSLKTSAPLLETLSTNDVINIGGTTALARGSVGNTGGALVSERGFCWNTTGTPTVDDVYVASGQGSGSFSGNLTGLTPDTKYYIRAYATNNVGTSYGNEITFSTFTIATVITTPATEITSTTAKSGGNILSDGGALVYSSGICWNTTGTPTISDASTNSGLGIGSFIHSLTGLMGSTTYYIRAYAINNAGTAYGNVEICTTLPPIVPTLNTMQGTSGPAGITARCGGTIGSNGGAVINIEGIVWSTISGFLPDTVVVNKTILLGLGNFNSTLNNLKPGTTYYARAYATNSAGTGYAGNEIPFTTFDLPVITTVVPTSITNVNAHSGGDITSNGGIDVFESGLCWSTGNLPGITDELFSDGPDFGLYTRTITELLGGVRYYVRAYARNSVGLAYGQVESFITQPAVLATILTLQPVATNSVAGISGGNILTHGGSLVTTRGIYWSTQSGFNPDTITVNKTAQTGYYKGIFNANLRYLTPNTFYYVRAYVINGVGISYGDEMSFITPTLPTLTTAYASSNGPTKVISGGIITNDGGADIFSRGVVWSLQSDFNPDTVVVNKTYNGGSLGNYVSKLDGLKGNTTYYIQAYATNIAGTSYGNLLSITTDPATLATLSTHEAWNVYGTRALTGGYISDNGGESILYRGVVWSTRQGFRPDTVVVNKIIQGAMGNGSFSTPMVGLARGTTYYARAYAVNSIGAAYGNEISFITFDIPSLTTLPVAPSSTGYEAGCGGILISDGGTPVTNQGMCWSLTPNPTVGLVTKTSNDSWFGNIFYSSLKTLAPVTKYYTRAYAINDEGTSYGNEVTFTTPVALAVVTTTYATPTSKSTVMTGGNITFNGGAAVTQRGVVWSTNASFNPDTIAVNKTVDGSGNGNFNSLISKMQLSISYFIRAYAVNSAGTSYGNQVAVTLFSTAPILYTVGLTQIAGTTAMSGGEIASDGGAPVTLKGICWSTTVNPTIDDSHTSNGSGTDSYTAVLTGLVPNVLYYVRAYAVNNIGTAYGIERAFQTNAIPTMTATASVTNIIATTASSGGEIIADGRTAILARGICWSTSPNPGLTTPYTNITVDNTSGSIGSFIANMKSLTPNTNYYVRAYATNAVGTAYGSQVQFTTLVVMLPSLTTIHPYNVDSVRATSGGDIFDDGGMPVTLRGICWGKTPNPTTLLTTKLNNATGGDSIYTNIFVGLSPGTKYYIRAYAINNKGTGYGNQDSLTTLAVRPTISNVVVSNTTQSASNVSASVITDGGAPVTNRGFCWNTAGVPNISDDTLCVGAGLGVFADTIKNLVENVVYYVRAFATNNVGTVYSPIVSLTTLTTPTLTTTAISGINASNVSGTILASANSGGNITDNGGSAILVRGVCWSTSSGPTDALITKTTNGTGSGTFIGAMTGMGLATKYYVRAYARNSVGIAYGNEVSFTTPTLPAVTTSAPFTSVANASQASGGGTVTDDGGITVSARGVCWSSSTGPVSTGLHTSDGTGLGVFSSAITGLVASTTYYVKAYATNAIGTAYGTEMTVLTPSLPTLTTATVVPSTEIGGVAASGGYISSDGGSPVLARGVCWAITTGPLATGLHSTDGTGTGDFISSLTGLNAGIKYYVRAYARNNVGTAYGYELSFTTPTLPTVTTAAANSSYTDPTLGSGGGEVTLSGGSPVTARGIYWSTSSSVPVITTPHSSDGTGVGVFNSVITGLASGTTYYVTAYAVNVVGTAYGAQVTVKAPTPPVITTTAATCSTSDNSKGISGGTITSDGGAPVTARGVCWSSSITTPLITGLHTTDGAGAGIFSSTISGLANGTNYYVRAYATNTLGTTYGTYTSFVTKAVPTVTTTPPIISTSEPGVSQSGGNVTDDGGATITARGVCWSLTNVIPTFADTHTSDGAGTGAFLSTLTGLDATKKYYVRAYAINAAGIAYGSVLQPVTPLVSSGSIASSTTDNSVAFSGGTVTDEGGAAVLFRGVCWNTGGTPLATAAHTLDGTRTGSFSSSLTGLANGTTYYFRAYATNVMGTTYGGQTSFTTKSIPTLATSNPTVSTDEPGVVKSGGNISDDGGSSITARGVCWSLTNVTPTLTDTHTSDGAGMGTFLSTLTGLNATKKYYVRAYATNAAGTAYGNVLLPVTPLVSSGSIASSITDNSVAFSGGTVTDEGGASVLSRGVCWNTGGTPLVTVAHTVDGTRTGSFSSSLTGLVNGTTYYFRAYATNVMGTTYGGQTSFTTKSIPTLATTNPTLSTDEPGVAKSGGNISDDGGSSVTARGVCWSLTNVTPTLADTHTSDGAGTGTFLSTLTGLDATKKYYARAYATNAAGTAYGNVLQPVTPLVSSGSIANSTTDNSVAFSGGTVTDEGGASVLSRGVCWNTGGSPSAIGLHTTDGTRTGSFNSTLTGLANGTTYYFRAYVTNVMGTTYGGQTPFTTKSIPTLATTNPAVSTDEPGVAKSGGNISDDGGAAVTARGVCWSLTNVTPTLADTHTSDGAGTGTFLSTLTGLDATKKYYARAYAINAAGTAYGNVLQPVAPLVSSVGIFVSASGSAVAVSGGTVTDEGGASVLSRGVCWNTVGSPLFTGLHSTDGTRTGTFSSTLTGLTSGATYYFRAYATNAVGTTYGGQTYFTAGTITSTITTSIPTVTTVLPVISTAEPGVGSSGGNITSDGGTAITSRGICWSLTNATPTLADTHSSDGSGAGNFSSILTGLDVTKKYYVRAYAINAVGTAYGNVVIPTTPSVITGNVILSTTDNTVAVGGGTVTDEGGASVTARGICWSSSISTPLITGLHTTDGTRTGTFSSTLTGLLNGTLYYVRAYATNAMGTVYGSYVTVTTDVIPTITTTLPVISTAEPGVGSSGGNVTSDGGAVITSRGVCWSLTNATPSLADTHSSDGTGAGIFGSTLTGLDVTKKYYVRAYATNSAGTAYGNVVIPATPTVITGSVTLSTTDNTVAAVSGTVIDEGGASVASRGVCWSSVTATPLITGAHTTDGSRSGAFSSSLTGLSRGTVYYVRSYATNVMGTVYGSSVSFVIP